MRTTVLALVLALHACYAFGQQSNPAPQHPPPPADIASHPGWPKATPADADTVDHLVAALYDVISGPPTKQRDWDRFRSLFLPSGRLGPIRPDAAAKDGKPAVTSDVYFLTPAMYAERDDPYFKKQGFFENAVANRVEQFGNLVHVWSTYESRHDPGDAKPFARGINSIQIVHASGRYWLASVMWDSEREGLVMPDRYLSNSISK